VVSGKNGAGDNVTNGKLGKNFEDLSWGLGVQDLEVWGDLTPVCDFYLCHFYLKLEQVLLL